MSEHSMILAQLLGGEVHRRLVDQGDTTSRTGAVWLARNAVHPDSGDAFISVQAANEWLTQPRTAWMPKPSIQAVAALLFGGDDARIYTANAMSMGLSAPRTAHARFVASLPAWLEEFTVAEQQLIVDYVNLLGRAKGLST